MMNKNVIKGIGKTKNNVFIQLITESHYNSNKVKKTSILVEGFRQSQRTPGVSFIKLLIHSR
jgi:hypothetical protein